ncbi:SDR family NAD(P)-dependent oxidoreductase [Nonomuraea ferruginea]|uniref:SDR family NAD(P)-dependent oxidoreductase n=1 Tax=Nonomuraea ferruginea TaxID=46174 RepID=A0ABT4T6H9_9ACTN|nr:SDR family oxidoreductase [Nonomuraea ferruginea]MDA0644750.1 SDR family NAD(P)-dependent oxidoreductase [Nonomuraea ferruginea]
MTTTRPAALVTGASRGIGLAIAERLAAAGHDLTICARGGDALAAAGVRLAALGAAVRAESADMAAEDDVRGLARAHEDAYGRLDVLVVAAGVGTAGPVDTAPLHRFDKQFAVNVRAPYTLVQALLPTLRATAAARPDHGVKIIMLSSLTGAFPEPGLAAYGASKAALISLCRSLNAELSADGVTATAICPGYVDTDMSAWVHDRIDPADMIRTADVAELAMSLTRLSSRAVVSELVVTRPGGQLHRA